jgi:hypothetical protein
VVHFLTGDVYGGKKEPCTAKKDLGIIEVNQDSGENQWLGVFHIFGAAGLRV